MDLIYSLLLLFIFVRVSLTTLAVYNNECTSDSDCSRSNGVCSHYTGVGRQGRCMCDTGYIFTGNHFRCEIMSPGNAQSVVVPLDIGYLEQSSLPGGVSFIRTRGYIPSNWYCSYSFDYCWGYKAGVSWSIFGQRDQILSNLSIPVQSVSWKCDSSYKAYIRSSDMTDLSTYSQSMRPLEDNCVACNCGAHGTCFGGSCVCETGYSGSLCQIGPSPTSGYYWNTGVFVAGDTLYQGNRACTTDLDCGDNEQCWHNEITDSHRCWCKSGYIPSSFPTECVPTSVTTYMGAVEFANVSRSYDGYYSVDSRTTWWQNATTEIASFSWYPVSSTDTYYRANFNHMRHVRCRYAKLGRVCVSENDCTVANLGILSGPICNCSRQNFVTGVSSCLCATGFSGVYCNITAPACSVLYCNDHGSCQNRSSVCNCNTPSYFSSDCSLSAATCSAYRCISRGLCYGDTCACDTGYYGTNCSMTTQQCRESRCNGHGSCVYQTQSCSCDQNYNMYDCRNVTCLNGGIKISDSECSCLEHYSGDYCQTYYCGDHGVVVEGACQCTGVYTGSRCTETICGDRGSPTQDGMACNCYAGFAYSNSTTGCIWDCNGFTRVGNNTCICEGYYYGPHCTEVSEVSRLAQLYGSDYDVVYYLIVFIWPFGLIGIVASIFWKDDPRVLTFKQKITVEAVIAEFLKISAEMHLTNKQRLVTEQ